MNEIDPVCLDCLKPRLLADYSRFLHRAVVMQPLAGSPEYVFQPLTRWYEDGPALCQDVDGVLGSMDEACRDCKAPAGYVWIESECLNSETFASVLDQGFSRKLLLQSPPPVSVCAVCCVNRILGTLSARELSYLEICAPRGDDRGFVLPMAN